MSLDYSVGALAWGTLGAFLLSCPRGEKELAADQTWRDQSPVPSEQRSEDDSRDEHRRPVPTLSLVRWGVPRLSRHGWYPEHDTNDDGGDERWGRRPLSHPITRR